MSPAAWFIAGAATATVGIAAAVVVGAPRVLPTIARDAAATEGGAAVGIVAESIVRGTIERVRPWKGNRWLLPW